MITVSFKNGCTVSLSAEHVAGSACDPCKYNPTDGRAPTYGGMMGV